MLERVSRVPYIDGLRACAVLGVIVCHAALLMPAWAHIETVSTGIPLYWFGHVLVDGAHGVDLFFVLSGFCLSYPTLARIYGGGGSPFDLVRFATHRLVRILPPYILAIVVFALFGLAEFVHTGIFSFPEAGRVPILDIVRQFFFLDQNTVMVNANFWTLAVEFRWYFLFPFCLALWLWSPRFYVAAILAAVLLYAQTRVYNLDLGVLPAFLLGIVAADVQIRNHPVRKYAFPLALLALIAAFLTEPFSTMPSPSGAVYQSFFLQSNFAWHLVAFFFVLEAGKDGLLKRALSNPALVITGVASYSIYLMHSPLMFIAAPHLAHQSGPTAFLILAAIGVGAGFVFWWFVERHFTEGASRDRWHARVSPSVRAAAAWLRIPSVLQLSPRTTIDSNPADDRPVEVPELIQTSEPVVA